MNRLVKGRFSRRDLLRSARVALVATVLLALCYAAVVAVLDVAVSLHLTGQVERQLTARLVAAKKDPAAALSTAGVQTSGAASGLGIYGEPIGLWSFGTHDRLERSAPGDPVLPASTAPPAHGSGLSLDVSIAGTPYRLEWTRTSTGWLLAAESLIELGHVEAVLIASEAIAFPFLLVAFFLMALAIGLRSARPIEEARMRQLEFTADASHELRTPLSVIEAEVSLARLQPRELAEYEATLDRIGAESTRLRRIVEDLLWLARADSDVAPPSGPPADLSQVATECVERFGTVAAANDQHLELSGPPSGEPLHVAAPLEWVERVAETLTDNACRYSGQGARIQISALEAGASRVALRVEDDGPGIAPDARAEIVQRFKRATTKRGGHGLGLAITSSVARRTGGSLFIGTSELGGALFELSWPRADSPVAPSGDEVTARSSAPRERDLSPPALPQPAEQPR